MGQGEETRTVPSRAATPALQPTVITIIRKSGAHLWLYIVNSGALMLLIMGYVLLASYFMELAVMTTSENVEGTKSTLRTTENHTMASFITSSAAGMLNRNPECKAHTLGYRSMQCPKWNPSARDPLDSAEAVDYRIRYLWEKQHPVDCSNASYLVTVDNVGFDALMRGHYAGPFAAAMRSDRVFILNPDAFPYAGCNGTSWTCYFEPLTNCSYNAHVTTLLETHAGARKEWKEWTNASHKVVHREGWGSPEFYPSDRIPDDLFKPLAQDELVVGLYLYMMRLNAPTLRRVEDWLQEILPCDLDPSRTIALPIRASDKCIGNFRIDSGFGGETSCPDFDTYMELCEIIRENDPHIDTILLTSEDARFVEARHPYTVARGARKPWRFILNSNDVMQASGDRQILGNNTMDDVFMSFFATMQMQLRGKYYVLKCGSNYHGLIRQLVIEGGCGFVPRPIIICMNDQASRFKICPGWNRDEFDKCMDAKLSEEERELKEQEMKRRKVEEEEEKRKKVEEEVSKKEKAEAGEIEEDMVRQGDINEGVKRRLKLELRQFTWLAEEI